jgi:acetyl-CoA synthetase
MSLNEAVDFFEPSAEFVKQATISGMDAYKALCAEAEKDYTGYWARLAREHVAWKTPFTQVLDESNAPFFKWFADGTLNASYNCLDRNVEPVLATRWRSSSKPTTAKSSGSPTATAGRRSASSPTACGARHQEG